jgi:hypothetical protein
LPQFRKLSPGRRAPCPDHDSLVPGRALAASGAAPEARIGRTRSQAHTVAVTLRGNTAARPIVFGTGARSTLGATTRAATARPSLTTTMRVQPCAAWCAVSMLPESSTKKPVPVFSLWIDAGSGGRANGCCGVLSCARTGIQDCAVTGPPATRAASPPSKTKHRSITADWFSRQCCCVNSTAGFCIPTRLAGQ